MKFMRVATTLVAVAAGSALATSHLLAGSTDQAAQPAQLESEAAVRFDAAVRQVVTVVSPSVVRVFFGEGDMLTGTLISADGTVLTCAHLPVPVGETVTIGLLDGRRSPAKVVSKLPDAGESRAGKDIALVRILDPGPWPFAPVAEKAPVSPDEPLLALGFPDTLLFGSDRAIDPLYVRMGFQIRDPYHSRPEELSTTIRGTGGDSGGPLFDLAGRVVGVVHGGDLSGAHMAYTRIEVLRQNWARLAEGIRPPEIPAPQQPAANPLRGLADAASRVRSSVVEVHANSRWIALGCVVGDGLVLTKASELGPNLTVVTADDCVGIAEIAATDSGLDLALLRLPHAPELTSGIAPISWGAAALPAAGTPVVLATSMTLAPQIGVTCFEAREVPPVEGFIPCEFEQGEHGVRVVRIVDELRRFRLRPLSLPLRAGDTLTHIEGLPVKDLPGYKALMFGTPRIGAHPRVAGEPIRITFNRGDQAIEDRVSLEFMQTPSGQLVRPSSARYSAFPKAIATDLSARPEHCGAPVVDAHGRVLGILIARAPFVESLVLPAEQIAPALGRMIEQAEHTK